MKDTEYQNLLKWLYSQVSNFQKQGESAYKPGFSNILKLCDILGNPQKKIKTIHIAGTNGKGSTSNMVSSILIEAGYKTGLYTSPHLKNFTERIKINGEECTKDFVFDFLTKIKKHFSKDFNPSFFELTTAMCFSYFKKHNVDIAIIEVGLGGRLDSTNIILPEICAITSISLDHTHILGYTLEKIAFEKAGIIKKNIPLVIGKMPKKAKHVIINTAKSIDTKIFDSSLLNIKYESDLKGIYQKRNIKTAYSIINILKDKSFKISKQNIKDGFLKVSKNNNFLGRWQILNYNPKIICDTGHNEEGIKMVVKQLKEEKYENLRIVIGFVKNKDIGKILSLFPKEAYYYFSKPKIERGLDPKEYKKDILNQNFLGYKIFPTIDNAISEAKKDSSKKDLIFIGGSNFVVSEIL